MSAALIDALHALQVDKLGAGVLRRSERTTCRPDGGCGARQAQFLSSQVFDLTFKSYNDHGLRSDLSRARTRQQCVTRVADSHRNRWSSSKAVVVTYRPAHSPSPTCTQSGAHFRCSVGPAGHAVRARDFHDSDTAAVRARRWNHCLFPRWVVCSLVLSSLESIMTATSTGWKRRRSTHSTASGVVAAPHPGRVSDCEQGASAGRVEGAMGDRRVEDAIIDPPSHPRSPDGCHRVTLARSKHSGSNKVRRKEACCKQRHRSENPSPCRTVGAERRAGLDLDMPPRHFSSISRKQPSVPRITLHHGRHKGRGMHGKQDLGAERVGDRVSFIGRTTRTTLRRRRSLTSLESCSPHGMQHRGRNAAEPTSPALPRRRRGVRPAT